MTDTDQNGLLPDEKELWRNDQWRVTTIALEEVPGGSGYWIEVSRLANPGWIQHVTQKRWVDTLLFTEAYRKACELHGITPNFAEGNLG